LLRRKRVLPLVQAFGRLPSSGVELVLVGAELEPDYAQELRRAAAEGGAAERVRFVGSLPAERVAEELSLADVLVLPSALEGYGMVLSEALWAGVPVIAARVGAAEKLVGETQAGLLFDADDQAGLATALATFVADAALRKRLRHAAWSAAEVLPSWRGTALALRAAFT
jgi:glycosyltransferase involved in cell wall biosynthesis